MRKLMQSLTLLIFLWMCRTRLSAAADRSFATWGQYLGGEDSSQYSSLKQINKSNVKQLEVAWMYEAGPGTYTFNPLIVDGVMNVLAQSNSVVALDAAPGNQLWSHPNKGAVGARGMNYWENDDRSDRRLFFINGGFLTAIDARNGQTINSFGDNGRTDLRTGLDRDPGRPLQTSNPGRIFGNLIITPLPAGAFSYESTPADIHAYDVVTGKLGGTFHVVPQPGEFGYDTWPPDAWKTEGGVHNWSEMTIDEKRGIAYFPLGTARYDFYGANRKGNDLFGNSLLALDVRTGKRLWHFQLIHHDLWDYDLPVVPNLLTVKHDGKNVDIVAQATKFGFLYVFDRVTGTPLWPIEERPVPKSDMPNEVSWPTQPVPTAPPPFARQKFTVDDINPYLDPTEKARIRDIILKASNDGIYTPPAYNRQTIEVPGENGGANQGSTAADPYLGVMYVKTYDAPTIHNMTAAAPVRHLSTSSGTFEERGYALYSKNCVACHGANRERITYPKSIDFEKFSAVLRAGNGVMPAFSESTLKPEDILSLAAYLKDPLAGEGNPENPHVNPSAPPPPTGQTRFYGQFGFTFRANNGLSAFSPPWSSIVAYDLNTGAIKWRRPIGTTPGLAAQGIKDTGSSGFMRNGPVVTAGGLLFIGSGPDRMIHALDKDTGQTLWETEMDANPDGIPAGYEVAGRQYIAFYGAVDSEKETIAFKPGKPGAQGYYVYALPQPDRGTH